MLVICKDWNWNWYWYWKYYIFLTKGGDIMWLTTSVKLHDLLITWSRDKCKALYLPFHNTYGPQNWQSGDLQWGNPTFKVTWPFDDVVRWQMKKTYICTCNICICNIYGYQIWQSSSLWRMEPTFKVTWPSDSVVTWQMEITCVCTSAILMAIKVGRVLTYHLHIYLVRRPFDHVVMIQM